MPNPNPIKSHKKLYPTKATKTAPGSTKIAPGLIKIANKIQKWIREEEEVKNLLWIKMFNNQ